MSRSSGMRLRGCRRARPGRRWGRGGRAGSAGGARLTEPRPSDVVYGDDCVVVPHVQTCITLSTYVCCALAAQWRLAGDWLALGSLSSSASCPAVASGRRGPYLRHRLLHSGTTPASEVRGCEGKERRNAKPIRDEWGAIVSRHPKWTRGRGVDCFGRYGPDGAFRSSKQTWLVH